MKSMERPASYVGVSGVVNQEQQRTITEYARDVFELSDTVLMLGVKAVHKTQWLDVTNKYGPEWYPVGQESFSNALTYEAGNGNVAQVFLEPTELAADPQYAAQFIRQMKERGSDWLRIIQFDMLPYHRDPEALSYIIQEARHSDVDSHEYGTIVQCHSDAMSEGPAVAIEKIKRLSPDEIDWVLFDASHGTGKTMDPDALRPFLDAAFADEDLKRVGFGIAGGLDERTVLEKLPMLLAEYEDLSWDAEGKLHKTPDGSLDMDQTKRYLRASADIIQNI